MGAHRYARLNIHSAIHDPSIVVLRINTIRMFVLTVDSLDKECRHHLKAAPVDVHLGIHDRTDEGVRGDRQYIGMYIHCISTSFNWGGYHLMTTSWAIPQSYVRPGNVQVLVYLYFAT